MDITKGDWIVDEEGDVGQVTTTVYDLDEGTQVWCRWLRYRHAEGWKKQTPTWICDEQVIGSYKKRLEAKAIATIIKSIIH